MRMKSFFAAAVCAVAVAAASAGAAFAGEITGPGLPGGVPENQSTATAAPDHAQSICAFSGLNHLHEGETPNRTQSWGQDVKAGDKALLTSLGLAPAESCNGSTGIIATGGTGG